MADDLWIEDHPFTVIGPGAGRVVRASNRDRCLLAATVVSVWVLIALAELAFLRPAVHSAAPVAAVWTAVVAVLLVVARRRSGVRRVASEWIGPLAASSVAAPLVVRSLTWSAWSPLPFAALPAVALMLWGIVLVDVVVLAASVISFGRSWRRALAGIGIVALTWTVLVGPADPWLRRARVELAADDLIAEAEDLRRDVPASDADDPFVAGPTVGWPLSLGMLGDGTGLIWDPDGELDDDGRVSTQRGYPWLIDGRDCERVTDDWLVCPMD